MRCKPSSCSKKRRRRYKSFGRGGGHRRRLVPRPGSGAGAAAARRSHVRFERGTKPAEELRRNDAGLRAREASARRTCARFNMRPAALRAAEPFGTRRRPNACRETSSADSLISRPRLWRAWPSPRRRRNRSGCGCRCGGCRHSSPPTPCGLGGCRRSCRRSP